MTVLVDSMSLRKTLTSTGVRSILRDCASAAGIHNSALAGYGVGLPAPKGMSSCMDYMLYIVFSFPCTAIAAILSILDETGVWNT